MTVTALVLIQFSVSCSVGVCRLDTRFSIDRITLSCARCEGLVGIVSESYGFGVNSI